MTARTHDAIAFASLITVAAFYPPESINIATLIISIIGADIGSAIPDMDGAGNRLWDMLPAGENTGRMLRRVFYKHRTITHSILGGFILYKFLRFVLFNFVNPEFIDPKIILVSIMIGFVSHLIADSLTEEGIPLLFPFRFTFGIPPIRPVRIKTGQWFENTVVYPAVWVYLLCFIYSYQNRLLEVLRIIKGI